jgi:pimeloyl-ACP methyl ester carboxylesterase
VASRQRLHEGPRARAEVILDDDVGGGPELPGQLHGVAAAQLKVALLVDACVERQNVGERGDGARVHARKDRLCAVKARLGRAIRTVDPIRPAAGGVRDGLAYTLWSPPEGAGPPVAGLVVLHGAGSSKESHYDFARAAIVLGFAVLTFDQRGHGESADTLDHRAVSDVVEMSDWLRRKLGEERPVLLRGSSMGGYLALRAAEPARAAGVVAICPAQASGLRRALEDQDLPWRVDREQCAALLSEADLDEVVSAIRCPVLLLHAQGDERVPVAHSRELAGRLAHSQSRLIEVPGGHHRSIQHDDELQAVSLGFLQRAAGLR